ncbi:antigen identified by monoclonal antibody Ki-67, partial [Coemansia nantahalensis]
MGSEPRYGHLVIISRSGADGKAFPMHQPRVLIGRKETCDIRMQRPQVSKEHCVVLVVNGEVGVRLRNLSENGTLVNTEELAVGQQRALKTGDVITVVGRSLRFEAPRESVAAPAAEAERVPLRAVQSERVVRRLVRPPMRRESVSMMGRVRVRDPATAIKLKRWDQHYGAGEGSQPSANELSDIMDESPPPGLLGGSMAGGTGLGSSDDPFASSGSDLGTFQRMEASVRHWSSERSLAGGDATPAPHVSALPTAANAAAVEARAHTPLASKKRAAPPDTMPADKRARVPGLCRSQSLPRGLDTSPAASGAQDTRPSPGPPTACTEAYGSEEETARGTIGMSPSSR